MYNMTLDLFSLIQEIFWCNLHYFGVTYIHVDIF